MLADALPDHYVCIDLCPGLCGKQRIFFDADFDMLMVDFQNLFGMSLHMFSIYMILP